jgi:hypothetical protein
LNEFKHINAMKRSSMSRLTNTRAHGMVTGSTSVNLNDAHIKMGNQGFLCFDEAMDMALLMPYNALQMGERRTLNPFLFYHE